MLALEPVLDIQRKESDLLTKPDQHPSSRKIVLSLVLLLVVTLLSILGVVLYSIIQVNEESRMTSEGYVAAIIEDKLSQQATLTKDYAYWDDTIQNAYLSQNSDWIDENVGEYLTDTFKITDLFIIDSNDKAVLSLKDGKSDNSNYLRIDKGNLTDLLVKARKSGPIPVPVSGILMINDNPALVGASILAPEDGASLPSPRPALFLARRLDPSYLLEISNHYRLKDLHFSTGKQDNATRASIEIVNPQNLTLGRLSWQPEKPGNLVLFKIQFPLIILLIVSSLITLFIIKAARTTARRLEKAYDDMAHLANHDVLTGLANRRLFNELLEQTINSAKRDDITCAMIFLDLDDFKKVNDTYGHQAGDQLLITVAERLDNCVRKSDTVARISGDEFTVLLRNTSSHSDIEATVQKILAYLTQPIRLSGNEVNISASVGITMIPSDGTDPDTLMNKADMALYNCKDLGRNTYQFYRSST